MKALRIGMAIAGLVLAVSGPASAQKAHYGFENLTFFDDRTPILSAVPDSGDLSFRADFTSGPQADAFQVGHNIGGFSDLFSNQILIENLGDGLDILTITLNKPISSLSLAFSLSHKGSLNLSSVAGTATSVGKKNRFGLYDGCLSFVGESEFSVFSLEMSPLTEEAGPFLFAIDNLKLNDPVCVPEPGVAALALGGLLPAAFFARRRMRR